MDGDIAFSIFQELLGQYGIHDVLFSSAECSRKPLFYRATMKPAYRLNGSIHHNWVVPIPPKSSSSILSCGCATQCCRLKHPPSSNFGPKFLKDILHTPKI